MREFKIGDVVRRSRRYQRELLLNPRFDSVDITLDGVVVKIFVNGFVKVKFSNAYTRNIRKTKLKLVKREVV